VGYSVTCSGSTLPAAVVALNKQKKAVIEWPVDNNKKKGGTIAQFYKAATNLPLQAKGTSWSNIYFTNPQNGDTRSLEDIKYLVKGPKKAVSAFLYFSKEVRETCKDLKSEDFAKRSGEMWKALPEEQRKKYRDLEAMDKERFQKQKAQWLMMTQQHPKLHEDADENSESLDQSLPVISSPNGVPTLENVNSVN